jgi:hypothetical protein
MKRKSILMTIVALLFAGVVWGQNWNVGAIPTANVKDRDTIFFCLTTDSLYPIELGYDVAGKRLHPSYGDWSLVAKTSSSVTVADYNMDGTKNGGAGNAYRTVGSGVGGLVFQYKAKDEQCGLPVDGLFLVYVFILPDENNIVNPADTLLCYEKDNTAGITITFDNYFKEYKNLYAAAGLTATWKHGGSFPVPLNKIETYSLIDTLIVTLNKPKYTCGDTIVFKLGVQVDSSYVLSGKAVTLCPADTVGDLGKRTLKEIFGRTGVTYTISTITDPTIVWTSTTITVPEVPPRTVTIKKAKFDFTYKTCTTPATKTSSDTLYIVSGSPAPNSYWGKDTVIYCRDSSSLSVFKLYNDSAINYPNIPAAKPLLTGSNSYWHDRDLGTFAGLNSNTKTGKPSLDISPIEWGGKGTNVQLDIMRSSIGYNYLWRVDPGALSCFASATGVPDSGVIVVIIQDPALAQDYTAQACRGSYTPTKKFSLNQYTGLNVVWTPETSVALTANDSLNVAAIDYTTTLKYKYTLPKGCGPGGTGVFYIKVTDKIKVPKTKTVLYCIDKLPASINANDVLGVAVGNMTWEAALNGTAIGTVEGFEDTGILNVAQFVAKKGAHVNDVITFKTKDNEGCDVPDGTIVTIKFVDQPNF